MLMKRFSFLLAFLLALAGGTRAWAETVTDDLTGYTASGSTLLKDDKVVWISIGASYTDFGSSNNYYYSPYDDGYIQGYKNNYSNNNWIVLNKEVTGNISIKARRTNSKGTSYKVYVTKATKVGETFTADKTKAEATVVPQTSEGTYTTITYDAGDSPSYIAICIDPDNGGSYNSYLKMYEVTYTEASAIAGPGLNVTGHDEGKLSFGLVNAGDTKVLYLSNPGTADITVDVTTTGGFTADLGTGVIIEAGGTKELTISAPDTSAEGTVTITPNPAVDGINPVTVNLSCAIKDPKKMFEDFSSNVLPDGWETMAVGSSSASSTWSFTNGWAEYSNGTNYSHNYDQAIATPILKFSDGEKVYFKAKKAGYYNPYLVVEYTSDGNTWTATAEGAFDNVFNADWASYEVTIPATARQIRFNGRCFAIDDVYGGEPSDMANLKFTASDYNFGMIGEDSTSEVFTIQNTGLAELTGLSVTSDNENFVVSVADGATTIDAKSSVTFTVTMKADNGGVQSGKISVKADDFEAITFNVSGYVADKSVILVNFKDNIIPDGWTNNGFTVNNNEISTTWKSSTLTSPAITVADGQKLIIYARGTSTYSARLTINTSTNEGNSWEAAKEFTAELRQNTTDYVLLTVDNIPAGNYMLQIEGMYAAVKAINGYNYNTNAPVMSVTPAEDAAFGKVTETVSKTYTVTNIGTGEMTVNIASDNEVFTVSPTQLVVSDEPQTFTVTFNYTEGDYRSFSGNITVTPTYNEEAKTTIVATAKAKNPAVWDEDFEEGSLPTGWEATTWGVGKFTSYENKTFMALAPSNNTPGTITTPCLEAKAGDVLTWDAYLNWYDEAFIVEYSNDDKATWNELYNYKTQEDSEAPSSSERYYHKPMSFTAPADGFYYLRFTSTYQNGIDNFEGFKLHLADHIVTIAASSIPESSAWTTTMKEGRSFEATVTVKESRGNDENFTAKVYMGEDVIGETSDVVEANSSKTVTIVCVPNATSSTGVDMHIEVEYAGGTLSTDPVTRYVNAQTYLTLDHASSEAITAGSYDNVTLTRPLAAGFNTICLPFAVNDVEAVFGIGAKAFTFAGYEGTEVKFTSVAAMESGYPYVVHVREAITEPIVFTDVTIASVDVEPFYTRVNGSYFRGTYAPTADGALENMYLLNSAGKVNAAASGATMKGFRGYLELAGDAPTMVTFDGQDVATGIEGIQTVKTVEGAYNLNGQKVGKAQKGLYIINGKKVVVK